MKSMIITILIDVATFIGIIAMVWSDWFGW